jgi:hypothetical protein
VRRAAPRAADDLGTPLTEALAAVHPLERSRVSTEGGTVRVGRKPPSGYLGLEVAGGLLRSFESLAGLGEVPADKLRIRCAVAQLALEALDLVAVDLDPPGGISAVSYPLRYPCLYRWGGTTARSRPRALQWGASGPNRQDESQPFHQGERTG